ncbi:M56 family metallopeptidase [Paraflavitalea sp. CAU 1676]|uniref:M56 family metallopeptidase n=1 Tax=Paraflavitalea sp. CAU 1676 TaxID=3032598 RepID=UPI0023DA0F86|nr:M56 family metallopeptidase [Paraflavitalea sp. CAU 1676]MDF2193106.1 M56 family metallopeptidase [Paraflavitalea sp. CAU 1676]
MPYIAQYLLKLSISLAVVYLFYALVLRRLTFHNWNRWYLLGYSLISFFIPFVNINPLLEQEAWVKYPVVQLIPVVGNYGTAASQSSAPDGWMLLLYFFIAGMLIMLIRLLVQYLSLKKIQRSSELISDNTVKIYQVNKAIIPFSFGRSIFINQKQHSEVELKEIIRHEFIHVKQRHTADMLWCEILCLLNWYNPFAWLIRHAIRQNLEFIADHHVLQAGLDRRQYQYLLLKVVGVPAFAIASQFNFSSLKKRIAMMNKMRSAKVHLIKFLFILPLVTVLLLAFRNAAVTNDLSTAIEPGLLDEAPLPLGANVALYPAVEKMIESPTADTVPAVIGIKLQRIDSSRLLLRVPRFDSTRYVIDASLEGPADPHRSMKGRDPMVIVDGVVFREEGSVLHTMDPNDIESVSILKDQAAVALYGERARYGVILVTSKKVKDSSLPKRAIILRPVQESKVADTGRPVIRIRGVERNEGLSNFEGIIVVDGKVYDTVEYRTLDLKPEAIKSIDVIKGPGAEAIYGPKGQKGVIRITTKAAGELITAAPAPVRGAMFTEEETKQLQEAALKNNILFIGVENQLPINIKGIPDNELWVTVSQGAVSVKGAVALIKPINPGPVEMTISRRKNFLSAPEVLEKKTFTAKFLPSPSGLSAFLAANH